ncbi:hypothetical protein [Streptomyces sp. NPDC057877]|uniref:hypothetical protein n=1 Tax=Streptomyces sp. NPDC057877 TaxID=3346269 RepID=UPI0036954430
MLAAAVLMTGCSSGTGTPPGTAAVTESAASPSPSVARALSQAELEAARLTEAEAPEYNVLLLDETLAEAEDQANVFALPFACGNVLEVLARGYADRAEGYTRANLILPEEFATEVYLTMTSYPPGRAEQVFTMVRNSLPHCESMEFESGYGERVPAELTAAKPVAAGDEAISVHMSYSSRRGTESHASYVLVRTGEVIALFKGDSHFGSSLPRRHKERLMPVVAKDLIARQVAKVQRAQGRSHSL